MEKRHAKAAGGAYLINEALSRMEVDADYAQVLKGKRVVVVGPAETLRGGRRGELIDSYDLVVRFNTAIEHVPFARELAEDIGTRTDILYLNNEIMVDHILRERGLSHERFAAACGQAAVRFFVSTNNDFAGDHEQGPEPECFSQYLAFKRFLAEKRLKAGFIMLSSTSLAVRRMLGGYIGRTGFIAIVDLLCYDVAELSVMGMTFYHKGGHLFFEAHAPELHPLKDHLGRETNINSPGHNSYLELEAMGVLAERFGEKLKVDEGLRQLFDRAEGNCFGYQ